MASEDIFASVENVEDINPDLESTEGHTLNNEIDKENEQIQQNDNPIPENGENKSATIEKESIETNQENSVQKFNQEAKLVQLPLSRIRGLMRLDPDLQIASMEAVFAVAKATEMFIESLAKESYTFTAQAKKKTIQKRDVDLTFASVDSLMFLEGAMNFN